MTKKSEIVERDWSILMRVNMANKGQSRQRYYRVHISTPCLNDVSFCECNTSTSQNIYYESCKTGGFITFILKNNILD